MARISNYLYNREVELVFDEFKHTYYFNGNRVPSVTGVLSVINKPALVNWAANMASDHWKSSVEPGVSYDEIQLNNIWKDAKYAHNKKKTDSADIGSFVHKWVEDFIHGRKPPEPVNDQLRESTERFLKWKNDHKVKFLSSEQVVYSREHNYCGTLDFICNIGGKLFLGDLKTSNGIFDEYWLQTAAYRLARTEEFPKEKYAGQAIIRIGKDGSFEFVKSEDYETHVEGFLSAVKLHRILEKMKNG